MKRKSLLFLLLAALFMPVALHAQGLMKAPHGTTLQAVGVQSQTKQEAPQNRDRDGWLQYDDNTPVSMIGSSSAREWTWGVMFPSSMLGTNNTLTKVAIFEYTYNSEDITINVYSGGDNAPGNLLYTETVRALGAYGLQEVTLLNEVTFDPSQNLWITLTETGTYVMLYCQPETVDSNGQWVESGGEWYHISDLGDFASAVWPIRGYVEYVNPDDCPKPTGVTVNNITGHTATLSWSSTSGSSWQICLNDNESNLITTNQNSYTLTGLNAETDYTVKVRTKCSNTDLSNWTSNVAFTTDVACPNPVVTVAEENITSTSAIVTWTGSASNYTLRYREIIGFIYDFESTEPWTYTDFSPCTTYDGDGGQTYGFDGATFTNSGYTGACIAFQNGFSTNMTAHNGNAFGTMFNSAEGQSDDWFILPELTIQNGDVFSFWGREITDQYGDEIVNIGIYGNTEGTFAAYLDEGLHISETEWTEHVYDLSAYAGQTIRLALNCVSNDVFGFMFDDVFVGNPTINWISTVSNATSPYALSSLTPESTYEVQVQAVCGGQDGSSVWSSITFTTLPTCVAPTDLTFSDITTTSAVMTWTGNANSYTIKLGDQTFTSRTPSYTFTGLTAATEYTVQVQSNCGSSGTSTWTTAEFMTEFCEPENQCELTFELTDSFGDTWNGNYILVVDVETMTIIDYVTNDYNNYDATGESGEYTVVKTVPVCDGREVYFVWYAGSYPGETSWVIRDANGDEITSGTGSSNLETYDILYTYTVDCTISDCHKPSDLTVTGLGPNTATLSWTENGEATSWVISGPRPINTITTSNNPYTFTNLQPETTYTLSVAPVCADGSVMSNSITFTTTNNFINDGDWTVGGNWYTGSVPVAGKPVIIQANATIPAGYIANVGEVTLDGGSITIADGGQLYHNTEDLEVTMKKNITAYSNINSQDNYYLVAFPFSEDVAVPANMTLAQKNDFYGFSNTAQGEEWRNNQTTAIDTVWAGPGYLYANPEAIELSMTGPTFVSLDNSLSMTLNYYSNENGDNSGWRLIGNPFVCDAYIYDGNLNPMEVMYYDTNGDMQTITCGPVPPMQGFFVRITASTRVYFSTFMIDEDTKSLPSQAISLDKKTDKPAVVFAKKANQPVAEKPILKKEHVDVKALKSFKK